MIHFLVSHFPSKMVLKAFCNTLLDILFAFRSHFSLLDLVKNDL